MTQAKPFALVLAVLLLPLPIPALDCVDYSTNPRWLSSLEFGAWRAVVTTAGDLAYVGTTDCYPSAAHLRVVDLADPAAPFLRASLNMAAEVKAIAAVDSHVLIVVKDTGLVVVDTSNPDAPVVAASLPSPTASTFELSETLLYLLTTSGIDVVDVRDPTSPVIVGNSNARIPGKFVVTGQQRAVALGSGYLYVYDLSDPTLPALVGEVKADPYCWPGDCEWFTDVAGDGDYAWVVRRRTWCSDDNCICSNYSSRLQTYDLSDPSSPASVGTIGLPDATSTSLRLWSDRLHVFGNGDRIFDVGVPDSPQLIHGLLNATAGVLQTRGSSELLISAGSALQVFDVTHVDRPHGVQLVSSPRGVDIARRDESILSYGSSSWTPCGFGCTRLCSHVCEFDLGAVPTQPIAEWSGCGCGYGFFSGFVDDIEVAGGDLYLAVPLRVLGDASLYRSDLLKPGTMIPAPVEVPLAVQATGLAVTDPYLFVAGGSSGLSVVDASVDPPALVVPPTGSDTQKLATSGARATAIGWDDVPGDVAFRAMDIALPTSPLVLGEVTWPRDMPYGFGYWVTVEGDVAAVGHRSGLLRILDVSDPFAPRVASQLSIPGFSGLDSKSGSLAGSVLYVAAGKLGIAAFDVQDPDAPVYRGTIATDPAQRVLATFDAVYATVGGGIIALPPDCATTATTVPPVEAAVLGSGLSLAVEPNPFDDDARLRWSVPGRVPGAAHLDVFDVTGRRVRSLAVTHSAAGSGTVRWDGRDASGRTVRQGVYFVRLSAGKEAITRKLLRIR